MKTLLTNVQALIRIRGEFVPRTCDILIDGDKIASIEGADRRDCDRVIDCRNKLAIPGLVNAHTHSYMTLFRNAADDLSFSKWLFDRILPMEDRLQPGDSYWTTLLGICEMIRFGTTSFLDMYIFPDDTAKAVLDSGIRAVISRGLVGETADDLGGLRRISEAKHDIETYGNCGDGRLTFMLAPHAPYSCAPAFLEKVTDVAQELGVGIHTHLSESVSEVSDIREKYGCTPIELMERTGLFTRKTAAAHCVHLDKADYEILQRNGVSVLSNPSSNMKLGNGFADVAQMLGSGINVALGTDSAASNNALNMFREMNLLSLIHKGTHMDAECISSQQALTAATISGAKALDINAGEIAVGKKADIVLLDLTCPQMNPPTNLVSSLCFSANGSEVDTVIVNGKVLMEKKKLLTIDEERVIYESNRIFKRVSGM